MGKRGNQTKGITGVVSEAAPAIPTTEPTTFHITSAQLRDPHYDRTAFHAWIAATADAAYDTYDKECGRAQGLLRTAYESTVHYQVITPPGEGQP